MVEHEVHVDMQTIEEDTFKKEVNQERVLIQMDYQFHLGETYRALEEAHDLTVTRPTNDGEDAFKILMGKSCKEVRLVHNPSLSTFFNHINWG